MSQAELNARIEAMERRLVRGGIILAALIVTIETLLDKLIR
jgi:hypothetical protein